MKFKLDENIPIALARVLGGLGHDVDTVPEEDLTGSSDGDVWARTQEAERLLITQDLDFADARRFAPGTHTCRGVAWRFRCRHGSEAESDASDAQPDRSRGGWREVLDEGPWWSLASLATRRET